jgi:dipeptidyl aminopeptidase/acylaminoacyl peptidase/peroxiredoxin
MGAPGRVRAPIPNTMAPMHPSLRSLARLASLLLAAPLLAQQARPLTHDDYDSWRSLRATTVSHDGEWVAYQIEPQFGDGVLEIRHSTKDTVYRVPLGQAPKFSADSRHVLFQIGSSKIEERDKKIEELRKKKAAGREGGGATREPAAGAAEAGARTMGGPAAPGGRGGPPGGGGRRGGAGAGGPAAAPGAGGEAGEAARERSELVLLELSTGKQEKLGKVRGHTLPADVPVLLYQPERAETKPDAKAGDAKAGEAKAGEAKAGEAKVGEQAEAAPAAQGAVAAAQTTAEVGKPEPEAGKTEPETGKAAAEAAKPEPAASGARRPAAAPVDPLERKRPEGSDLVWRDLATGQERRFQNVVAYGVSRKGQWLWLHTSVKQPVAGQQYGLCVLPLLGGEPQWIHEGCVRIAQVTFDRLEKALAFTSDKEDFAAEKPQSDLYLWDGGSAPARRIVHAGTAGMPTGKRLTGGISFSRDGSILELAVSNPPEAEPLPILPEDKVNLDLWNWRDGMLQTQQQRSGMARNPSWTAVYHRDQDRFLVLGDDRLRSLRFLGPDGSRMLGTDGREYDKEVSWDGRYQDVYLVNSLDGSRTRLLTRLRGNVSSSPGGRYLLWFADNHWWTHDVATGERRNLTAGLPFAFHKEDDDHPEVDGAHGSAGWTDDDAAVLLYDEFDLWKVSPATGAAVCVTDGMGRANRLRMRLRSLARADESEYAPTQLVMDVTQVDTMSEGVYVDWLDRVQKPQRLYMVAKRVGELQRPKHSTRFFFTQSTFQEYPDLWTANADFSSLRRLSDANPQQKDFRWGQAELVHWIDGNGERRSGILIKPDGFDPAKKYPMMVYFYERMTQGLHNYVAPAPGTSPNASYYVSNGYLWFMPDVVYEVGYPGMSCVKCVVSGVQHLLAQGFVDPKAIGAAGHSWGGYQTAFLVTRTNIFAAVESGAAVTNMISAYGGIRYSSGMSRQFQYEQTQSRIGGTPWEYPMRYWENSPIFFADKVQTPVLMLHNDQDGAVPWTQSIEYFTALRRLGKECYLFNYNGEDHGLRNRANMKDWTRRMSEFFAHHLKQEPAPRWMLEGVPFHEREQEKLPHAASYIDAYVKPPKEAPKPVAPAVPAPATEAPAVPVPASAPATGAAGQDRPVAAPAGSRGMARSMRAAAAETAAESKPTSSSNPTSGPKLNAGDAAPDFELADEAGATRRLADYRGKPLLLWFYPKADTPGCTAQGCGLRDQWPEFAQRGIAVLGISFDAAADNAAFRSKYELPFPLLSDTARAMAIAYGAAEDAQARAARRIGVLVDAEGKVVKYWPRVDPRSFAATVLAALPQ